MMVLILAAACGLGWVVSQTREQWLAVRAIVTRGDIVEYDYKYDSARNRRLPNGTPWRPVWLQKVLGDDYFHNVVGVSLDDVATDADLVHVAQLRHVKLLYLGGGRVTDDSEVWISPRPPSLTRASPAYASGYLRSASYR